MGSPCKYYGKIMMTEFVFEISLTCFLLTILDTVTFIQKISMMIERNFFLMKIERKKF